METFRPRALNRRPMLAAVMPLPSEEVTPPVTKTYFAMDRSSGGFSDATEIGPRMRIARAAARHRTTGRRPHARRLVEGAIEGQPPRRTSHAAGRITSRTPF